MISEMQNISSVLTCSLRLYSSGFFSPNLLFAIRFSISIAPICLICLLFDVFYPESFSVIVTFILIYVSHACRIFDCPGSFEPPCQVSKWGRCALYYVTAWSLHWQQSSMGFRPLCSCPIGDSDVEPPCQREMIPRWHGDHVCGQFGGLMAQIPTQVCPSLLSPAVQLTLENENTMASVFTQSNPIFRSY